MSGKNKEKGQIAFHANRNNEYVLKVKSDAKKTRAQI